MQIQVLSIGPSQRCRNLQSPYRPSAFSYTCTLSRSAPRITTALFGSNTNKATTKDTLVRFPEDFPTAIQQAQEATLAALADGKTLIEIEFPSASLAAVAGDAEGANEMTYSMQHLRNFCRIFQQETSTTRIFFPDQSELRVAKYGKSKDPNAGSWDIEAVWNQTNFQLDYLTEPSGLLDIGLDFSGFNPASRVKESDKTLIMAYPHYDPREMVAVDKIWQKVKDSSKPKPIILFNAELDRLRNGYYPALFYPQMARLSKEMVPLFEGAYYLHNFKGAGGGALFRAYPGPWQVFLRLQEGMLCVHTQEERPSLREVALEILPNAVRKLTSNNKKM